MKILTNMFFFLSMRKFLHGNAGQYNIKSKILESRMGGGGGGGDHKKEPPEI